jgi:DNA-binding CsgD family transcriptional regulator
MGGKPDYIRKKFAPLQDKTLKNALAHRIGKEFPRIGGPRILQLCAEMVLEVVKDHIRPKDHVTHGQVLWMGISVDDPPAYKKKIANTDLIPLVLDITTAEDIQARLMRKSTNQRLLKKVIRLCKQAYLQGALLSNCDLAELINVREETVARLLAAYERESGEVIPRRATLHDVGSGMTHKRIICWKRYSEGKSPEIIARETYHSLESVDRYLGQYDRVRHCRQQNMSPQEIAYMLNCSLSLVEEYLDIDRELGGKNY